MDILVYFLFLFLVYVTFHINVESVFRGDKFLELKLQVEDPAFYILTDTKYHFSSSFLSKEAV